MAEANGFEATIEKGVLIIRIPLEDKPAPSSSGKTLVVATTHGNQKTDATVEGAPVHIGVNAYIKPSERKKGK